MVVIFQVIRRTFLHYSLRISVAGQLVMYPMTNLTRAKQTLQEHSLQQTHVIITSMKDTVAFWQ